jgi:transcriptional regulator with XRE-family HTH domain
MEEKLRLRYWRNFRAFTVRELADKAEVTPATITKIENHGHLPTNTVIRKLATALGIEPGQLYSEGVDISKAGKNSRQLALNPLAA